jgi:hypothetical protein
MAALQTEAAKVRAIEMLPILRLLLIITMATVADGNTY